MVIGFIKLVLGVVAFSFSSIGVAKIDIIEATTSSRIETFTFLSNGTTTKGKIYLPAAYETNENLPAIFLIDYTEQHFKIATDEFEKVIDGVRQIGGFDALVVSLDGIPDIDAEPETFQNQYEVFKNMALMLTVNTPTILPGHLLEKAVNQA